MISVLTIPAFDDNYLWIIHDGQHAIVVDPGDAAPILAALAQHQLSLSAILLTHHHNDHIGGVSTLLNQYDVPVFGPSNDQIASITHKLSSLDVLTIPKLNISCQIIDVPGHTKGHIAYYFPEQQWLFCGDTLFGAGCGRLFEGSPAQMLASLDKLAALPDATAVYCAHEYTLSNCRFALAVEPNNIALIERNESEISKRNAHIPTIPSSIGLEKQTNPFLRSRMPSVTEKLLSLQLMSENFDEVSAFAALREWKNNF